MTVIFYEDDHILRNIGHECEAIKGMADSVEGDW